LSLSPGESQRRITNDDIDDTVFLVEDEDGNKKWEKVFARKVEGVDFMKRRQLLKDAKREV
jgi:hypothetical protein